MSKDEVLNKLGKPKLIYNSDGRHVLDDLPKQWYRLGYGHIEFHIDDNAVQMIKAQSPSYKFNNGLGVGDSEDKIKQAFGKDFQRDGNWLIYKDKKLHFQMDEENRTSHEIEVYRLTTE